MYCSVMEVKRKKKGIYSSLCFHLCHWIIRKCKAWPAQVDWPGGQDLHVPPGVVEKCGRVPLRAGEAGDCIGSKKNPGEQLFWRTWLALKWLGKTMNSSVLSALGGFFVSWLVVLFCSGKWLIRNSLVIFHYPYSVKCSEIKPQYKKWIQPLGKLLIPLTVWWGAVGVACFAWNVTQIMLP